MRSFAVSIHCKKNKKAKEAERRQTQGVLCRAAKRMLPLARAWARRALKRSALVCRRSAAALAGANNAAAQLQPALPGTRRHRVLPASGQSIQSSELPRSTGRSAGRAYPPEPPGSALMRPRPREPPSPLPTGITRLASLVSELIWLCNRKRDGCQGLSSQLYR